MYTRNKFFFFFFGSRECKAGGRGAEGNILNYGKRGRGGAVAAF